MLCGVAAGIDEEVGQDRPEQCSNQLRRPVEEQVSRCEAASNPDGEAHGGVVVTAGDVAACVHQHGQHVADRERREGASAQD